MDLITAFEAGVQNVIAPQGTAFTPKQARILKRYVDEVILCFDSDAAGEKAAERSLPALLSEKLSVRIASLPKGEDPDSLIRTQGAEAFLTRMNGAPEFFDAQIDRLSAVAGFDSARGRTEAARKIVESVGWITDPVLREFHVQKIATRLEMAPAELNKLASEAAVRNQAQAKRAPAGESGPEPEPVPRSVPVDPTIELLAHVLLHSSDARQWLLEEAWENRLNSEPQGDIIEHIMRGSHLLEEPETLHSFLGGLDPGTESFVSTLLNQAEIEHPLEVAQDCWNELERRQIRRRIDSAKARQRNPALSLEESGALHQQILDLQKRLFDIARPFSPFR